MECECEVVCLVVQGLFNEEIGQCLLLVLGIVKWYLYNIYEKFKVCNCIQVIW